MVPRQKVKEIFTGKDDDVSRSSTTGTTHGTHSTHTGEGVGSSHVSSAPQQASHISNTKGNAQVQGGNETHDHQHLAAVTSTFYSPSRAKQSAEGRV